MLENQEKCNSENPQDQKCPTNFADLDGKLEELKKIAGDRAAHLAYAQRAKDSHDADVKDLEKAIPDLRKIVSEYNKVRLNLAQEWDDLKNYYCNKKAMVDVAVGNQRREIQDIIDDKINVIKDLKKTIPDKNEVIKGVCTSAPGKKGAEYELMEANMELAKKTDCFETWKAKQRYTEDTIKSLKGLRDLIEAKENEAKKNKFVMMYYYLTRFKEVQDRFENSGDSANDCPISPFFNEDKEFEDGLITAWCEKNKVREKVLDKQQLLDEAKRDLKNTEDKIKEKEGQLESDTLKDLEVIETTCAKGEVLQKNIV